VSSFSLRASAVGVSGLQRQGAWTGQIHPDAPGDEAPNEDSTKILDKEGRLSLFSIMQTPTTRQSFAIAVTALFSMLYVATWSSLMVNSLRMPVVASGSTAVTGVGEDGSAVKAGKPGSRRHLALTKPIVLALAWVAMPPPDRRPDAAHRLVPLDVITSIDLLFGRAISDRAPPLFKGF